MSDINKCERLKSPCFNNGSGSVHCENTNGSYLCHSLVVKLTKPPVRVTMIAIGMFIWIGVFSFSFYFSFEKVSQKPP
jgi:hypothetical protein